jgi:hypothetical protein
MPINPDQLGPPVAARLLMRAVRARLDELVATLGPDDRHRPTVCPGWDVADLVAHLIGDDLGPPWSITSPSSAPPTRAEPEIMSAMDRAQVERWVALYERLWRSEGTGTLGELFAVDATYIPSPWARPVGGLPAIAALWEAERDGPNEPFTMTSEVVAVDGRTAVVRVAVEYGEPTSSRWRDLWVLRFNAAGRCAAFEEWPFAPDQPDGHG